MDVLIDQEKMDAFAMYADQHELFDLFERMLTKMLIEKPQDPLTWMQEQLQKPAGRIIPKLFILLILIHPNDDISTSSVGFVLILNQEYTCITK